MQNIPKELKIKREKKRLTKIVQNMDKNKLETATAIIERMAFITVSIRELEEDITEEGWVEEYINGENQRGMKKSAKADVHISLTKNLTALTKQLLDIVPESERKGKLEEMMRR